MPKFLDLSLINGAKKLIRFAIPEILQRNQQIVLPSTIPNVGDAIVVERVDDSFPNIDVFYMNWGAASGGGGGGEIPDDLEEEFVTYDFLLNTRRPNPEIKQALVPNTPANKVVTNFSRTVKLDLSVVPQIPSDFIIPAEETDEDGNVINIIPFNIDLIPDIPAYKIIPEEIENDEGELVPAVLPVEVIPDIPPEKIIGGGGGIKSVVFEFSEDEISENDDVIFEHNFDTFTPICSIYDNRNEIVYGLIEILDENRIRLDLSNIIFQTGVFRIRVLG